MLKFKHFVLIVNTGSKKKLKKIEDTKRLGLTALRDKLIVLIINIK